jgi:hypothetical protein
MLKNRRIESLVNQGLMDGESAGCWYEKRGDFRNAIRHYPFERGFDIAIDKGYYGLAEKIIRSVKKAREDEEVEVKEMKKEYLYQEAGVGATMCYGSCLATIRYFKNLETKFEKILSEKIAQKK